MGIEVDSGNTAFTLPPILTVRKAVKHSQGVLDPGGPSCFRLRNLE
jgi:hypothetical protein